MGGKTFETDITNDWPPFWMQNDGRSFLMAVFKAFSHAKTACFAGYKTCDHTDLYPIQVFFYQVTIKFHQLMDQQNLPAPQDLWNSILKAPVNQWQYNAKPEQPWHWHGRSVTKPHCTAKLWKNNKPVKEWQMNFTIIKRILYFVTEFQLDWNLYRIRISLQK